MRLDELDYDLPEALIAQEALAQRDQARLLIIDRKRRSLEHSRFYKLPNHLREGDVLILNDTRVLPARVFARKETGARIEMLFVRPSPDHPGAWIAMLRGHRPLKEGTRLIIPNGEGDGAALRVLTE